MPDEIGSVCRVFRYANAATATAAWESILRNYRGSGFGLSGQRFALDVKAGFRAAVYVAVLGEENIREHVEECARMLARTALDEAQLDDEVLTILRNKRRMDMLIDNGGGHVVRYLGGVPLRVDGIPRVPRRQG